MQGYSADHVVAGYLLYVSCLNHQSRSFYNLILKSLVSKGLPIFKSSLFIKEFNQFNLWTLNVCELKGGGKLMPQVG